MKNVKLFIWVFRISTILLSAFPFFLTLIFRNIHLQLERSLVEKELNNAKFVIHVIKTSKESLFNFYSYNAVFLMDTSLKFKRELWNVGGVENVESEVLRYKRGEVTKAELLWDKGIIIEPYRMDTMVVFILSPDISYIPGLKSFNRLYFLFFILSILWIIAGFVIGFLTSLPYGRVIKGLKKGEIESVMFLKDFLRKEYVETVEREKRKREEFLKITTTILENIPRGVGILNKKRKVVLKNDRFDKIMEDYKDIKEILKNIPLDNFKKEIGVGERFLLLKVVPFSKEQMFYVEIEDITEEKKMREIKEREERFMLISEVTSSFLHEIRNSLSSLNAMISLIDLKIPEMKERFEPVKGEIRNITQSLIHFNEILRSKKITGLKKMSLRNIVGSVVEEFIEKFKEKEFEVRNKTEDVQIEVSPFLIKRAILNILKNSYEAIDEKGIIEIYSRGEDNIISLIIEDNGCGMEEEEIKKALLPFYTTKDTGLGLGLSFVKKVMELHGGEIELERRIPRGLKVILKFRRIS